MASRKPLAAGRQPIRTLAGLADSPLDVPIFPQHYESTMRHFTPTFRRSPLLLAMIASLSCVVVTAFAAGEAKPKKAAPRPEASTIADTADDAPGDEMPDDVKPAKKRARKSAAKDKAQDKPAVKEETTNRAPAKIDHSGDGRVYDKQAGLSLVPPEGWQRATATQSDRLRFFAPQSEAR